MAIYTFGNRRNFAFAFAWHEAQSGALVKLYRDGSGWRVSVGG